MRQKQTIGWATGLAIASLGYVASVRAAQPEIDTTTDWSVEQHTFVDGKASLTGLRKNVRSSRGAIESVPCFGEMTVPGVLISGQQAPFVRAISQEHQRTAEASEYLGAYQVEYAGQPLTIRLATKLFPDGKFKISATADSAETLSLSVPIFLNYDFHGPGHDVFEFAWNVSSSMNSGAGQVVDPPVLQASMAHVGGASSMETVDYFATVPNGVAVTYRGLHQRSIPSSIEYTALARVYDAYAKLGVVFWPWSDSGEATTDYTLVFQRRSDGPSMSATADPSAELQQTSAYLISLPRYAVDGSQDQAVTVVLEGAAGAGKSLQLAGKLFQKSDKRELKVNLHVWDNLFPWVPAGSPAPAEFVFDPDREVTGTDGATVSFRRGLSDLVGDPALLSIAVHHVDPATPNSFDGAMASLRDFSVTSLEDVESWQTDLLIWPGSTNQQGLMPDILGGGNGIEREAAIINWNAIHADAQAHAKNELPPEHWSVTWQLDRATLAALHELGHTFGFTHEMALNHTPAGDFTDLMNNAADHLSSPYQLRFAENCTNWFRVQPEGWAKPGRHGVWFFPGYPLANQKVDPLYQPVTMALANLGDVNHDGAVDITDALRIARASVGLEVAGDYYSALADVNCDGSVTIVDALAVARFASDLTPAPSCPAL